VCRRTNSTHVHRIIVADGEHLHVHLQPCGVALVSRLVGIEHRCRAPISAIGLRGGPTL
jgi:hypothetical protein